MDEEIAMVENTAEEVNPSHKQTEILPADTQKHERSLLTQTSSESANLDFKLDLNKAKENSTIEAKKVPDAKQIFEALDSKKISEMDIIPKRIRMKHHFQTVFKLKLLQMMMLMLYKILII